jgi:hypothetical protein
MYSTTIVEWFTVKEVASLLKITKKELFWFLCKIEAHYEISDGQGRIVELFSYIPDGNKFLISAKGINFLRSITKNIDLFQYYLQISASKQSK